MRARVTRHPHCSKHKGGRFKGGGGSGGGLVAVAAWAGGWCFRCWSKSRTAAKLRCVSVFVFRANGARACGGIGIVGYCMCLYIPSAVSSQSQSLYLFSFEFIFNFMCTYICNFIKNEWFLKLILNHIWVSIYCECIVIDLQIMFRHVKFHHKSF